MYDKFKVDNIKHKTQGIRCFLYVKAFLAFAFCLFSLFAFSAKPVTVIVSLTPPYTPFLNEYGSAGVDKLQVSLIVNDSRMINYPAKLQMLIEHVGSGIVMRTSEYAAIAPIMLTGNVTEVFNGFDLNKYFLAQNNVFTGFDQSQYMQTGRVPDGQYRIGFRIVDAQRTDVVLSNTAYTQPGWFVLNDPPQINLPRNKEKVRVNDLQNVKLEWFPRHLGSLNAAFATSYQVELFAIRVPGMHPNQVSMSMQPDFTDVTNRTSYYLTNDKYLLEPGVEYAFRVKAMTDGDQLTLFQNNGYSEVFSFIYGSLCPEPNNGSAQTLGIDKVEITWDTDPLQTSFETRFRKAGQVNDAWHTRESYSGMVEIANVLSPGVKYEYQVKAKCTTVESDYTQLDYFTMPYPPPVNFECGATDSVIVTNTVPKAGLQPGEMIFYGKFPIKLTEVSGSNGIFTGKGRMRIPFLANIQVNMQFNGIKVNELNEVYEGELVSIYNPDSKFLIDDVSDYFTSGDQVGNVVTGEESAAITLGYVVDNTSNLTVTVTGTTVTVTGPGGSVSADIETATGGTTISDSEGNLYVASEDGSVSKVGTSGGASDAGNYSSNAAAYNQLSADASIEFLNDDSDIWAFDQKNDSYKNSTKISSEYELLGDYYVPWKLIPEGKSGKVKAKITSGSIDPNKVVFKTPTGTEYSSSYNGSEFELTIVGSEHGDAQEIYALYQENDSITQSLGKLKAASYNIIKGKLAIVPIGDAELSAENVKSQLDDIYLPYSIEWEVRAEPKFTNMDWAGDDQKLDAGESGFFSAYTAEMKALNNAFKAERTVNDDEVYLFVFNTEAANVESGVLLGDMPFGYQFGYLFSPSDDPITAKTIAHELGHGMFQLKHTFDNSYGLDEGTTANLMDYSSGEELVKQQWDAIFDPQILIAGFLQDDEDGALASTVIKRTRFELVNANEESRFDDNDKNSCSNYPTYLSANPIQEGARWYYTSSGRQNNLKINVSPPKLSNNVVLHSKDNRVVLSNIQKVSNPITFTFSTNAPDTGLVVYSKQDSINGNKIDGLNIISCKPKNFNISVFILQDSTKRRPPSVNFQDIEDYFNQIYRAINVTATFTFDTVKMNFSNVFDRNGDWKVDKNTESRLLSSHNVNNNVGYKVYIIDLEITRVGLNPGETIGGLAIRNTSYPLLNPNPIAIVTTLNNTHVPSSVAHELGHLIFGLHDVFLDPLVPGFTTYDDQFNLMDYVNTGGSYIYSDRKLRAYQVIDIENKTP